MLALATCMFPSHPNAALWRDRCIVYMINAFSTAADHHDERLVDGKPLKEWVSTVCIHDDFTLENHNRVHPDYLSGFTLNLRNAIVFAMAGQPAPEAAFHHAADCLKVLLHLSAANGGLFYVNGQDWWPHRHDVALMAGGLAGVFLRDPQAAFLEQNTMDWLEKMHSRFEDGRAWDAREFNYPNAEEELMARYCETYLAHRLVSNAPRPVSRRAFEKAQSGVRIFEAGGFVTHRTPEKFVSFAWLNGGTGLVYPEGDTWFTSPYERSLVGQISIVGTKDTTPQLEQKKVAALNSNNDDAPDGFAFVGRFTRSEGIVGQSVAMISLPGRPVIYAERLQARADVHVDEVATGIFAMLNEDAQPLTRNERTIWTAEGRKLIRGASAEPTQLHVWNSDWVNLDDRLTIVANSGHMTFEENHAYARSRLQQLLIANHQKNIGSRRTGEIISDFAMVLVPNAGHREKIKFRTEPLGKNGVVVDLGDCVVAINFADDAINGNAFGKSFDLGPLDFSVRQRR